MTEWLLLGLAVLLMVICGVFVAAEFSFVTVDRASVDRDAALGDRGAIGVQKGLRTLSTQLSGAQVGITLTNLFIGFLAEPSIAKLLAGPLAALGIGDAGLRRGIGVTLALILATMITMLIGELIPKTLALALPMKVARATQAPQRAFTFATGWLIKALNGAANKILRLMGVEPQEELRSARSAYEISALALRSAGEGKLESPTARLVARSIAFGDRIVADVRTPRVRTDFLDAGATVAELLEASRATGHTRFPVINGHSDEVIGITQVKDAVRVPFERRGQVKVHEIMAAPIVVPDSIGLDIVLPILRESDHQLAVVVDEFGGTDGVVTLEDLAEELVGDIADEHDPRGAPWRQRTDGAWVISAMLRPDEVAEQTGYLLPEHDDYETIAGLVQQRLGSIGEVGSAVIVDAVAVAASEDDGDIDRTLELHDPRQIQLLLTVQRMEGRRIDRVTIAEVSPQTNLAEPKQALV